LRAKDCWSDPRPPEARLSNRIARLFDTLSDPSALCSGTFDQALVLNGSSRPLLSFDLLQ
jgi:hypothetical protein